MKLNFKNKNKGITLIALIITIIVLLILAGISISALTNQGLFGKAKDAGDRTTKAQLKEEISLAIQEIQVEEIPRGNSVTLETLANGQLVAKMTEGITATLNGNEITGEYKNYNYTIDSKFNVKIENKIAGIILNFAFNNDKEYTNEDIILTVTAVSTEGKITEIQEKQAQGLNKNQDGTYTITKNGTYEFTATDDTGNSKTKQISINKIDKLNPTKVEVKAINISLTSFTAQIIAEDAEATEENSKSGIEKYEYYIKEASTSNNYTKSESNNGEKEFSELELGKKYSIYVRAYDKANNYKDSDAVEVETLTKPGIALGKITFNENNSTVEALDYPTLTLDGIMNCEIVPNVGEKVKVEITSPTYEKISYYYSIDGGTTWVLYTGPVETEYVGTNKIKTKAVYNNDSSIESEVYTLKNYKKDLNYTCTASDALSKETYDGDFNTYDLSLEQNGLKTGSINIEPECWGKYLNIYCCTPKGGVYRFYFNWK